ncbi:MAG: hypothetical protein VKL20_04630 [Synechocystis sp.]|nr:hypothetical protein [Synechocystis sp.]
MIPFLKWSAISALIIVNSMTAPIAAQVAPGDSVPSAQDALSESGLDDITDQPTQLITWVCQNGDKAIAVEAKEMDNWQSLLNKDSNASWQCAENIPTIPDNSPSFSCESSTTMGLMTVFWLAGEEGKAQMKTWMNDLANNQNLVCTRSQSNPFWE